MPRLPAIIPVIALLAVSPVPLRAETEIRIVGATSMSEREILSAIGGRLDHIRLRAATRPRAADAAFLVEQIFEKAGFNDVTVYWKILGPNSIRLRIDEGGRDVLGQVTVEGVPNPKLNRTLADLFKLGPQKAARGMSGLPLRDENVGQGISRMQAQMKSIGFYDAEITVRERRENPETGATDFFFAVDPGGISTIAAPVIEGETVPGLRQRLDPLVGEPATTPNLNSIRARVVEAYSEAGFLRAKVRMTVRREGLRMTPAFTIERGQRFKLRNIEIAGLEKTREKRVLTRIDGLRGTYLDGGESSRRIRQMIATGAFSTVETEITPVEGEEVDVTLRLTEADARGLSGSLGFDSFEGLIIGGSYFDRNFRGSIRNFSAGFELTQRSLLGEISLADPWIRGSDIGGRIRLFAVSRDFDGYDVWRSGLEASAVWPVSEHYTLEALLGWNLVTTDPDGLPPAALGLQDYQNPRLTLTQSLDYRDNPVLPTSGWHLEMPIEVGAVLGSGGGTAYFSGSLGGSYHHSLGENAQLSLGARGGVIIPGDGGNSFPIDMRQFIGGARSVRSFPERELGPWSFAGFPVGGEGWWVANVEYVRTLAGPLRAVAFLDAGGLSSDWRDFGLSDPEIAAGLGIRLDLPIGPVRLEYGHNLTRDGRDPSGSWHFAIGTAF